MTKAKVSPDRFGAVLGDVPENFTELFSSIDELVCVANSDIKTELDGKLTEVDTLKAAVAENESGEDHDYEKLLEDTGNLRLKLVECRDLLLDQVCRLNNAGTIGLEFKYRDRLDGVRAGRKLEWDETDKNIVFQGTNGSDKTIDFDNVSIVQGEKPWIQQSGLEESDIDKEAVLSVIQDFISKIFADIDKTEADITRFLAAYTQSSASGVIES